MSYGGWTYRIAPPPWGRYPDLSPSSWRQHSSSSWSCCRPRPRRDDRLSRRGDELAACPGLEPPQRALHVLVAGRLADPQKPRDLGVLRTLRDEIDDLSLTGGECRARQHTLPTRVRSENGLDEPGQGAPRERPLTARDSCDGPIERARRHLARDEARETESRGLRPCLGRWCGNHGDETRAGSERLHLSTQGGTEQETLRAADEDPA